MIRDTYEKIRTLRDYYHVNRKRGHTKLMKNGTKNYEEPFFIITPNMNYNGEMECRPNQVVSWNALHRLYGEDKPIAFDNSTLCMMFEEICDYVYELKAEKEKLINHLQEENESLKRALKAYIGS